jgi:hypothetical protein
MMSTSETSLNVYRTAQRYNPEDSHLDARRRQNLISYELLTLMAGKVVSGSEVDFSHTYLKQRNKISLQTTKNTRENARHL